MLFGNIHWKHQNLLETIKRLETRQNLLETKLLHWKDQTEIRNKNFNLKTVDWKHNS